MQLLPMCDLETSEPVGTAFVDPVTSKILYVAHSGGESTEIPPEGWVRCCECEKTVPEPDPESGTSGDSTLPDDIELMARVDEMEAFDEILIEDLTFEEGDLIVVSSHSACELAQAPIDVEAISSTLGVTFTRLTIDNDPDRIPQNTTILRNTLWYGLVPSNATGDITIDYIADRVRGSVAVFKFSNVNQLNPVVSSGTNNIGGVGPDYEFDVTLSLVSPANVTLSSIGGINTYVWANDYDLLYEETLNTIDVDDYHRIDSSQGPALASHEYSWVAPAIPVGIIIEINKE